VWVNYGIEGGVRVLSDRRRLVLRALIEEYIARALPVGSRTLVERYNLGISSATVRSELSLLEDMGYLTQPHTSAGRIPTDYGYRAFVDDLLKDSNIKVDESTLSQLNNSYLLFEALYQDHNLHISYLFCFSPSSYCHFIVILISLFYSIVELTTLYFSIMSPSSKF